MFKPTWMRIGQRPGRCVWFELKRIIQGGVEVYSLTRGGLAVFPFWFVQSSKLKPPESLGRADDEGGEEFAIPKAVDDIENSEHNASREQSKPHSSVQLLEQTNSFPSFSNMPPENKKDNVVLLQTIADVKTRLVHLEPELLPSQTPLAEQPNRNHPVHKLPNEFLLRCFQYATPSEAVPTVQAQQSAPWTLGQAHIIHIPNPVFAFSHSIHQMRSFKKRGLVVPSKATQLLEVQLRRSRDADLYITLRGTTPLELLHILLSTHPSRSSFESSSRHS
ncbi:hypothetical protein BDV98DRAFT_582517 [Pterulicium gracile]|uniref:Uncharacterized protein n=1 Tax=Pterulicium gracile TaxID=1884261 RepID=A0A5C3QKE2_9AGAR|nr:hypothetical protein BDV98DRAFT_582517 [Pterula gracilis]